MERTAQEILAEAKESIGDRERSKMWIEPNEVEVLTADGAEATYHRKQVGGWVLELFYRERYFTSIQKKPFLFPVIPP